MNDWLANRLAPAGLRHWRRWGGPALAGALCLLGVAWLHAVELPARRVEWRSVQDDLARALRRADAARPPGSPRAAPNADHEAAAAAPRDGTDGGGPTVRTNALSSPADRFSAPFPPAAERHPRLAALLALARLHDVATPRLAARWLPDEPLLARYDITMPVQAGYAPLRAFVADALRSDASLSLDGVTLRRADAAAARLDGELRWSLHLRGDAAAAGDRAAAPGQPAASMRGAR